MSTFRIFSGGDMNGDGFAEVLPDDKVICADKGVRHALKLGIKPDIIVGDFDSWQEELPEVDEVHRSVPEKDDTDTLLAVRTALERGADRIVIYGALGGRFDHTLANLQTLNFIREHGCEGEIVDGDNEIRLCGEGEYIFPYRENSYFSVFSAGDEVLVEELSGVKYPLHGYRMTNGFPIGVSNEITAENAYLKISGGSCFVVRSAK